MRRSAILSVFLLAFLALSSAELAGAAAASGKIRLAQTSAVTTCMMSCNSQAAACQSNCLMPVAGTTGNATANTSCQLGCSTQQIACQTTCAQHSPSQ